MLQFRLNHNDCNSTNQLIKEKFINKILLTKVNKTVPVMNYHSNYLSKFVTIYNSLLLITIYQITI